MAPFPTLTSSLPPSGHLLHPPHFLTPSFSYSSFRDFAHAVPSFWAALPPTSCGTHLFSEGFPDHTPFPIFSGPGLFPFSARITG